MTDRVEFAVMNGLGNKILVVDMRGRTDRVNPAAAVALAADPATAFDQIMAIHDPRTPGTANYIEIINSDGSRAQACGNGMRCVVQALAAETGTRHFVFETIAGILTGDENPDGLITVDMGRPRLGWNEIPLSEEFADTTGIELQIGPIDAPLLRRRGQSVLESLVPEGLAVGMDALGARVEGDRMAGLLGAVYDLRLEHSGLVIKLPVERLYAVDGTPREAFVPAR